MCIFIYYICRIFQKDGGTSLSTFAKDQTVQEEEEIGEVKEQHDEELENAHD